MANIKVILVHDWLTGMRGGERCLEVLCEMFPEAPIYTLFYRPEKISETIRSHEIVVSGLGKLPGVHKFYRHLLPFYPQAVKELRRKLFQRLKRERYDLVISVSHCAVKNIFSGTTFDAEGKGGAHRPYHLCYCLTPMRYIWDQYQAYFAGRKIEPLVRRVAAKLRPWDVDGASGVDHFVGISNFVRARIERAYGRESEVIYPPCRTDWITPCEEGDPGEGFLCVNALVPYKNVHVIVQAFNQLGLPLTIVGSGPQGKELKRIARPNIRFLEFVSDQELADLYRRSKALIFAAEEDFGMTPVEMQAAGRPVIAWGRGGALETVVAGSKPDASGSAEEAPRTGVFFPELTPAALCEAVHLFLDRQDDYKVENCLAQARKFSLEKFHADLKNLLDRLC